MKIGIASDHRGFELKQKVTNYLNEMGYTIIDYGTTSQDSTDYPFYAFKIGEAIKEAYIDKGILICGTGIGMSIACNKVKKVRCAKVDNENEAYFARLHNNANVIALGEKVENPFDIIKIFLDTEFSNEVRHLKRVEMIDNYDN